MIYEIKKQYYGRVFRLPIRVWNKDDGIVGKYTTAVFRLPIRVWNSIELEALALPSISF